MQYAATFDPNAPIQVAYNTPLGVYTRKADTGPRLKLVVRPDKLEKAGLDAKTTATKVMSFETATIAEWKKHTDGSGKPHPDRPTLENVKVAVKMLCQEEALHWTENRRFIEAAFARAAVIEADEHLVHELTEDATTTSVNHFTLHQKLKIYIKAVDLFEKEQPSRRTKFPNLSLNGTSRSEPSIQLPRMLTNLQTLGEKLSKYSFGRKYGGVAKEHGLLGLAEFCKWCDEQGAVMSLFLSNQRLKYERVCKACARDPATPMKESSWKEPAAQE